MEMFPDESESDKALEAWLNILRITHDRNHIIARMAYQAYLKELARDCMGDSDKFNEQVAFALERGKKVLGETNT